MNRVSFAALTLIAYTSLVTATVDSTCTRSCLNTCELDLPQCFKLCGCDSLLSDSVETPIKPTALSNDDSDPLTNLYLLKKDWVEYQREIKKNKNIEAKIKKIESLALNYHKSAEQSVLETEKCEMSCATQCIKPANDIDAQLECFQKQCNCLLKSKAQEILNRIHNKITACNSTCVNECDVVRNFLDEEHYQFCLEKRCDCPKGLPLVVNLASLEGPATDKPHKLILGITLTVLFFAILMAVAVVLSPSKSSSQTSKQLVLKIKDKLSLCRRNSTQETQTADVKNH